MFKLYRHMLMIFFYRSGLEDDHSRLGSRRLLRTSNV